MRPMGRLRWKMLALMLCGTIVIYVDRNVLGVLAPILKKDLNFSTEQYSGPPTYGCVRQCPENPTIAADSEI